MRKLVLIVTMLVGLVVSASAKMYTIGWVETDAAIVSTMWSVKEELKYYGVEEFTLIQLDDDELVEKATADLKYLLYVKGGFNSKCKQWCSVVEHNNGDMLLRVANFGNGGSRIYTVAVYKVVKNAVNADAVNKGE